MNVNNSKTAIKLLLVSNKHSLPLSLSSAAKETNIQLGVATATDVLLVAPLGIKPDNMKSTT